MNLIGTSHHYVDAGTSLNLANSSFTVVAWAKRSTTAGKQWIIGYGANRTDKALVLGFRDNDHVTCAFFNDDLDTDLAFADTNVWHHIACTYDLATRKRTVYVDKMRWEYNGSSPIQASGTFNIGRVPWGEGYFSGNIDDVRVYNRALSIRRKLSFSTTALRARPYICDSPSTRAVCLSRLRGFTRSCHERPDTSGLPPATPGEPQIIVRNWKAHRPWLRLGAFLCAPRAAFGRGA